MKNIQPLEWDAIALLESKEDYKGGGERRGRSRGGNKETFLSTTKSTHPGWEAGPKKMRDTWSVKLP